MRFGVHIRLDKGLLKSLDRARELECEAVQLFSGNPSGWARRPLDPDIAAAFARKAADLRIYPIILHTPYLVNLASPDENIWAKSKDALADAVMRTSMLGGDRVVTHIGSHKGAGYDYGVARIADAVKFALDAGDAAVALELGAGAGNCIGSRFEEIADILDRLNEPPERAGICIDTAHLYGAGYDISTAEGVHAVFEQMKRLVGIERLMVAHLNDTLMQLASHRDRHHHIGQGNVGIEGFRAIVNYPGIEHIPGIIETPGHDVKHDSVNLAVLRGLAF